MKRLFCCAMIALGLAVPMFGQLSDQYENWNEGPVKWLLTDEEQAEWATISSDAEAQEFIDLFWARRDPSPGTPLNEMREGFEQRVEIADQRFTSGKIRGAMSHRGQVFILLGGPYRISRTSNAPQSTHQSGFAGSANTARGENPPSETWFYERENRPPFASEIDFEVSFVDYYGNNDYELVMGGRRGVSDLLATARTYYIAQPGLTSVPDYTAASAPLPIVDTVMVEEVSTEFENQYLEAAYDEFKRNAIAEEDDLHVTYGEYITPTGQYFVPVQLYIPGGAGIDTAGELTFFGVVEKPDGEIVAVYEEPVTLLASNSDSYYDISLMLQPGKYVGTFGLARDNKPVAIAKAELALEGLNEAEPSVSNLILSNNIFALSEAQEATDPYAFGGIKVVPKGDVTFQAAEELWYFFEIRNPGLTEEGTPTVRVKLEVEGERTDGSPLKMAAPMMEVNAEPVKDTPGHFMVGRSFPGGAFPPGSYTLKARVFDSVAKQTWNLEQAFHIVE